MSEIDKENEKEPQTIGHSQARFILAKNYETIKLSDDQWIGHPILEPASRMENVWNKKVKDLEDKNQGLNAQGGQTKFGPYQC